MGLPIITVAQMREWEQATWASGITEAEVIERVGKYVAQRATELTSESGRILLLAGKGHNGDDARAAVRFLSARSHTLLDVDEPSQAMRQISSAEMRHYDLVVDGLFGIGINRPLNESWQKFIHAINESEVPVLSIDVPSGLNADTGEIFGAAIRASVTLTVGVPKRGLLLPRAIKQVGRLDVASDVGLLPCPFRTEINWSEPQDFAQFPPNRSAGTHKGTYGHLVIFAGSTGYHGAAVLAARGALRAQPGLVTLFTPENVYLPVAAQLQAAMVHPWHGSQPLPESCSAILFGPGLAAIDFPTNLKNELCGFWQNSALPVIADASALDWLPQGGIQSPALRIITPHPGEAARLLQQTTEAVQKERVAAVRALSARYGNCRVVLKGHQTLIGRSSGEILVNSSGNPFLAQGGSGDVLAGFLGGLLAQARLQNDPAKTISCAVWQHGAAADFLQRERSNWTVEDLVSTLDKNWSSR